MEESGSARFFHGKTGKIWAHTEIGIEFPPAAGKDAAEVLLIIGNKTFFSAGFQNFEKGAQFEC